MLRIALGRPSGPFAPGRGARGTAFVFTGRGSAERAVFPRPLPTDTPQPDYRA